MFKRIRYMLYAVLTGMIVLFYVPIERGIDKDLKPYVENVYKVSKGNLNGRKLHIGFTKFRENQLGTCFPWRDQITINKKHWQDMNHYDRILLIAHEIAHCQKGIKHIDGLTYWGCAKHFMHYQDTGKWCNRTRFKEYVKQMQEI